jgi:Leucine Rich repeat
MKKILFLIVILPALCMAQKTSSEYKVAMSNRTLVASYLWWQFINPRNLLYTDTGIVNYSLRDNIQLAGWVNSDVSFNFAAAIANDSLVHLKVFRKAKKILLRDDISDVGLNYVGQLNTLTELKMAGGTFYPKMTITDNGMQSLANLTALEKLAFYYCTQVTDKGFMLLSNCTKLKELDLTGWEGITDNGLTILKQWSYLEKLNLARTKITDEGLQNCIGMKSLTELNVEFTAITNKGLTYINQIPTLTRLIIGHTQINDDGKNLLIELLHNNPSLKDVSMFGTSMSRATIAQVSAACPGVAIHY